MFLVVVLQIGCSANRNIKEEKIIKSSKSLCPEDGVCTFEVLKNKSFKIKKDEFGLSYFNLIDSDKIVLKFQYKRNEIPNTQDGGYVEEIFIEIDENTESIELKDSNLKNVNATFARLCFCRGQTGYYPIKYGNLSIKKLKDNYYILKIDFKIDMVPQVMNTIEKTFSL